MINCIVGGLSDRLVWRSSVDQTYRLVNPQDIGLKNVGPPTPGRPPEYVMEAMVEWSANADRRNALINRLKAAITTLVAECYRQGKYKIVIDAECLVPIGRANMWGWQMTESYWLLYRRVTMGLLPMVLDWAKNKWANLQFTVYNLPQGFTVTILSNEPFSSNSDLDNHWKMRQAWYDGCNLEARALAAACWALTPCCYLPDLQLMAPLGEHLRYCREIVSYCKHLYPGKKVLPFISPFKDSTTLLDIDLSKEVVKELKQAGADDICVWGYLPVGDSGRLDAVQAWIDKVC